MKLGKLGKATMVMGAMISAFGTAASADTMYLIYKGNDGAGRLSLVYESVHECETNTNTPCVQSEIVCGGHKFATTETSYQLLKNMEKSWGADWRVSVEKDAGEAQEKYEAAEESNFEIKLCERASPSEAQADTK